jgi:glycosyltransferase involved in cell wall biosynthesis
VSARTVPTLSILMPAHNEADHIEASVMEWHDQVVSLVPDSELVVVDDCSTDGTGARLDALSERLPLLRILRTPANGGHGQAVRFGLDRCAGEFVFQTDSDRQHTPADFAAVWARRHDAEFVFGVRERRADGPFRTIVSWALRGVNVVVFGEWIRDANCPFKLMRREALNRLLEEIPPASFIPMVMVSVLARRRGYRVIEIPVRHFARRAGQQSLTGAVKWGRTGARCLRELLALRRAARQRLSRPGGPIDEAHDRLGGERHDLTVHR